MSAGALDSYGLVSGLVMIGAGLLAVARPQLLARSNKEFVESGRETHFEQRRAWEHYPSQRPETDPAKVRRRGWLAVAGGLATIALMSPISIFHWS